MTIAQIKAQLSIMTVLAHYGLSADKNNMLHCPWHEDKKPSMKVYAKTNTVYCFAGSCDIESLDVIDFIMHREKSSKREAILKAKTLLGKAMPMPSISLPATAPARVVNRERDFAKYMMDLQHSPEAQDYLKSRCLPVDGIGYKKGGDRWARGCVIFALRNKKGEAVSLYGRSISGTGHYYQEHRSGLYPCYPPPETEVLILGESIIDTASLQDISLPLKNYHLLALYGTNGLNEEHQKAIQNLKHLREIIFALDADEAGRRASRKYAALLREELPAVKITTLCLPEGEDLNSLAVTHDKRTELFGMLFQNREKLLPEVSTANRLNTPVTTMLNTSNPYNIIYQTNLATYYVKGGIRHTAKDFDSLKVSLVVANKTGLKSRNKLDLYEDKQVERVARVIGDKLELRPDLLEIDLQLLTDELENYREKLHREKDRPKEKKRIVPQALRGDCMSFLKAPNLLKNINELIGQSGIAGEENNRLLLFVIASSYKMPDTLHALIQGSSGSGKTRLMKIIADVMPEEDVKRYTRVTDNSFYNQDEYFFVNKLVCFEDLDGLKEDAQLAVRELQSNEILRTSTSIKDQNGSIFGGERVVRGPIASLACTTHGETYEDNISRSFLVAVDESREQTQSVIDYQNQLAAGQIDKKQQIKARVFLQNCIRLLRSYEVVNPFAGKIELPREAHKIRRLNELYQSFVRQITLLNQYRRKTDKQGRLITQKEDMKAACDILFESIVLKVDELDGSLRQFFEKLKTYIETKGKNYEFNRFEIRRVTGVGKTQQHYYINRLVALEYLRQYGHANRGYRYAIAHWDNMSALRARIKTAIEEQLEALTAERQPEKTVKTERQ
ncbi:MAG TPA: hypothetical protein ENK06_02200 [Gammaproteobacteria bacterium]|nr:hypothetical protein [Gammaproteobacteria bacterium]